MTEQIIIQTHSTNPDDPDGPQRRYSLLHRNRELAEHFVSQSVDKDVCVLIVDLTEAKDFPDVDQAWVRKVEGENCIPAVVLGMTREQAYGFMKVFQKRLSDVDPRMPKVSPVVEQLNQPAKPGHFHILVISRGKQLGQFTLPE